MRGHVRRRGTTWAVVVDVGRDESGRRRQSWHSGFRTRHAAEEELAQIVGRLQNGSYVKPDSQTVAPFMREWLDSIRATVRASTWATYQALTERHIIPALGRIPLQKLTPARLNALYATLLRDGHRNGKGGLSARSVRYVHVTIHKALADAVRWNLLPRNVADQASAPRQQRREMGVWTAPQLRAFLDSAAGDRLYAAYFLAATTGLRRGEVLGLRWRDLDLNAGRLGVSQTLISVYGAPTFSTPKTAKGRRSVALDTSTVAELKAHRLRQLEERVALGLGALKDDALVFSALTGGPYHPDSFSDRFERLIKSTGLPRIRLHDLRHTHATLALQAGIHPKVVSERLGHASIAITLDVYSHAIPALQEEAAEKVAALVFGA